MRIDFEIPDQLPTLNEYISAERANRYMAAKMKRETQEFIMWHLPKLRKPIETHVYVYFLWIRKDARADKDNVAFAKKYILDAMQERGIIKRDSWKLVTPYDRGFMVNKTNPRTVVTVSTERIDDWN